MATKAKNLAIAAANKVDGTGNVSADTLDGIDSPQFLRSDADDTFVGSRLTISNDNPNGSLLLVLDDGEASTVSNGSTFRVANNGGNGLFAVLESSSGGSDLVHYNNGLVELKNASEAPIVRLTATSNQLARIEMGDGSNYTHISSRPDMGDGIMFYENGSVNTVMRNGNVGVGTSDPAKTLHLVGPDGATSGSSGNSDTALYIENAGGNGAIVELMCDANQEGRIYFGSSSGPNRGGIINDTDGFSFRTASEGANGTEAMRVHANNDVSVKGNISSTQVWTHTYTGFTAGSEIDLYEPDGTTLLDTWTGFVIVKDDHRDPAGLIAHVVSGPNAGYSTGLYQTFNEISYKNGDGDSQRKYRLIQSGSRVKLQYVGGTAHGSWNAGSHTVTVTFMGGAGINPL